MQKENTPLTPFMALALSLVIGFAVVACQEQNVSADKQEKAVAAQSKDAVQPEAAKEEHGHVPHHQGCLNAIETCEVGHAETKLEGDTLKVWFVGGGTETGKSVRVADPTITLALTTPNKETKSLVLTPKPNELAEEKVGDCSYFEGKAPWLAGLKEFNATGQVNFKGKARKMVIEYPKGYDPD